MTKKTKTKCAYCGKKVYPIFIKEREIYQLPTNLLKFTKPRNLKDFYYCKKHGIQRITRKVVVYEETKVERIR